MTERMPQTKQNEVIAEKSRAAAYVFLALAALGVVIAAVGVILLIDIEFNQASAGLKALIISLIAVGGAMLVIFAFLYVKQLYRPYALITLQDGIFVFPDGSRCRANQIVAIDRQRVKGNRGKIIVTLTDGKIEVDGVADYEKAYEKFSSLTGKPAAEK